MDAVSPFGVESPVVVPYLKTSAGRPDAIVYLDRSLSWLDHRGVDPWALG